MKPANCLRSLLVLAWVCAATGNCGEQSGQTWRSAKEGQLLILTALAGNTAAFLAQEDRIASLQVPYESPIQAAMLWSNAFPEQAVRYAAVVSSMNAPVHYYGLCVDQDGKPLAGVSITMRIRQWQGISPIDLKGVALRFPRTSEANGRFELVGVKADVATVESASLAGYEWIRSGVSIDFSVAGNRFPNPAKPIVLQFWKQLGAEPLFMAQPFKFQGIRCNGLPISYDLVTGAKTTQTQNPSVQFSMARNPEALPAVPKAKYDWQYTIDIPGGGIQETATNMPFIAPAEGYAPNVKIGYKADDPEWKAEAQRILFFKTSNGSYGRLEVRLLADDEGNEASFKWTSYLNPSGSPVLEYDPAKKLKAPSSTPPPAFRGAAQPPPSVVAPQPPAQKGPPPFVPQPPPGFQALTNRVGPFAPPVPPRPQ